MKLIVDSGSSKADWVAVNDQGKILFTTQTSGLNPEILQESDIIRNLQQSFELDNHKNGTTEIYFYGAGCGSDRMKTYLSNVFKTFFVNAEIIHIYEDTYAAVFATTHKKEKAIVCILGTGSNCSYFDGLHLHQKVVSLGYLIMDDCSGNQLGRQLLRSYYFNKMPQNLALEFENSFDLDPDVIKQHLYKEEKPNAYMAGFAKFLIQHKDEPSFRKIILNAIEDLVETHICQYDNCREIPIHFVGSIASYIKEELQEVLSNHNLQLGKVIQKPIDGLIKYHLGTD